MFGFVPPPVEAGIWAQAAALLARAVSRGGYELQHVRGEIESGHAQLWLTLTDGPLNATVTRMDGDTLEVWLCGGDVLSGSLPSLETILEAAAASGATNARIIGREGWKRVLRPYGWRADGETLVKDLDA